MNTEIKNQNVVLDFTTNTAMDKQELAILPASLAKKVLKMYADNLVKASSREIIGNHIDALRSAMNEPKAMENVVKISMDFINERNLIENCAAENWKAYDATNGDEIISDETISPKKDIASKEENPFFRED
jgi:hypothetical protein